jgi:prepilin peptidase CpaA
MPMPALLTMLVVPLCALITFSDLYARRVPNAWLLGALLLGAALFCLEWELGRSGPPWPALMGLGIGLLVMLPFYAIHWMGAGDVKLFATFGFLLGAKALLPIWIIASLIAGLHVIYLLTRSYQLRRVSDGSTDISATHHSINAKRIRGTPYAAFLSIGAAITLFNPSLTHW